LWYFSNTGSTALRLAEVYDPNTLTHFSPTTSRRAFSANVAGSDAGSSTTGTIFMPLTPPAALISSIAMIVAWFNEVSMIAVVPVNEYSTPTLISPPAARASDAFLIQMCGKPAAAAAPAVAAPLRNFRRSMLIAILLG
jgi:hypothetical protein